MKAAYIISVGLIILSLALAAYAYYLVPDMVASHWNAAGEVDGYMPKLLGLSIMPIITVPMLLLLIFIPRLDPLKKNVDKFRQYYDWFIAVFVFFMFYIQLLTTAWALGSRFSIIAAMVPAFSLLFFYCGVMMSKTRRNWFIGIKTPWTLSSDRVWDRTHRLGGRLFKAAAVIALLGLIAGPYAIWLVIVPALAAALYSVAYSYFEWKKEKK